MTGSVHSGETPEKSSILDEIDKQMSDLQNEIDRFSLKDEVTTTDQTSTPTTSDTPPPPPLPTEERDPSPPPLPPPMVCGTPPANTMNLGKPSLPEPEGPPPPPPIQNGYAFSNPIMANQANSQQQKEPIYESIKPRYVFLFFLRYASV